MGSLSLPVVVIVVVVAMVGGAVVVEGGFRSCSGYERCRGFRVNWGGLAIRNLNFSSVFSLYSWFLYWMH